MVPYSTSLSNKLTERFAYNSQIDNGAKSIVKFYDGFSDGELVSPAKTGVKYLSCAVDSAAELALENLVSVVEGSPEHRRRVVELKSQPRLVGKCTVGNAVLKGCSAFEQMVAIRSWLQETKINKQHTFSLAVGEDDFVPVTAKPGTMMNIILGSSSGERKAPKYTSWALDDPLNDRLQKRFVYPLESLEILRQFAYNGATLLKGNAYEGDLGNIDQNWRYGDDYACVESKGQSTASEKKRASAGLNLLDITLDLADDDDYLAEEVRLNLPIDFQDYVDEGYNDDDEIQVTPGAFMRATKKAIIDKDSEDVVDLASKLLVAKIGPVTTPALKHHIVRTLF